MFARALHKDQHKKRFSIVQTGRSGRCWRRRIVVWSGGRSTTIGTGWSGQKGIYTGSCVPLSSRLG